jgi:poly(A) polymerase
VEQPKEHFWNVFTHSLETVATVDFLLRQGNLVYAGEEVLGVAPWPSELVQHFASEVSHGSTRGVLLKLAALLHDVAKPQTRTIEADGRMRFLGHAQDGAAMVVNILGRLRFSTREVKLVETMVRHHLRPMQMSHEGLPSRRAIYRYFRDTAEAGIDTLILSLADHLATRGPRLELAQWREHSQLVEHVINHYFQEEKLVKPPKLVDGHDLIGIFGISPGPRMGELIEALCEAQATGELTTRGEALNYIDSLLKGVHG